jgi:hypothetical protein
VKCFALAISLFIVFTGVSEAQVPSNVTNFRFDSPNVAFDGTEGNTAAEQQNGYITRIRINKGAPLQVIATCTGAAKPWVCEIANVPFEIGYNVLYVTIQRNTPCTPPEGATPDYCNESGFSNPLTVFHAVHQTEIITNTQSTSVIRCAPGSYGVQRITDATKLLAAVNSVTNTVSNILATSNAIYIFSCTPVNTNP